MVMWKEWEMKKRQREMETKKTEIAMGGCINSDIERLGEEWTKRATGDC